MGNLVPSSLGEAPSLVSLLEDQRQRWQQGDHVLVETYLQRHPTLAGTAVLELIANERLLRQEAGQTPCVDEFLQRFPQWAAEVKNRFDGEQTIGPETVDESALTPKWDGTVDYGSASAPQIPDFEIVEVLGKGGMGVVYKARQLSLKRLVAIKMIHAGIRAAQPEILQRFQQEAEAVARLHHANIVQIFAIGEHDGCPYLVLEYATGGSLDRALQHRPQPGQVAAQLVLIIARALQHAHQHHVIHRDLKPSNILLHLENSDAPARRPAEVLQLHGMVPKITDFGLAKQLDNDSGQTQSGAILGTPSYMAPEQAAGEMQRVGPAADIYSLGAILYEMLTGRPPFRGATPIETALEVITRDVTPPSKLVPRLQRDLETICLKALAKEPERRYASALMMAQDLERFGVAACSSRSSPTRGASCSPTSSRRAPIPTPGGSTCSESSRA